MKKILVAMALVMGLSYGVCADVVKIGDREYSNDVPRSEMPNARTNGVYYRVGTGSWIDTGGSLQKMWNKNNELFGKNNEGRFYVYRGGTTWEETDIMAALIRNDVMPGWR